MARLVIGGRIVLTLSSQLRWSFVQIVFWRLHFTIFHLRVFRGQEKHGHAVNTQGACSQICCGESPRALGQRVPLGDRKTATLEPSAKHKWSCGSGVSVLCSSKVMPWVFARTPTERGSLFLCLFSNRCLAEARFKQIFLDASIGKTNQQTVQDSRGKAGRTCGCPHDG